MVFVLRATRVKLLMMLWSTTESYVTTWCFSGPSFRGEQCHFFAFLTFTGVVCLRSSFASEFLTIFEIFEFFFAFVMSISLGDPVGDALFTEALQSCSRSTWYGAFGAVSAIFTKSFTVAEFSLVPAVIVGATVVGSFDIVSIAIDTLAIFKNFEFLAALQGADAVCRFVAGATYREFIAIDFIFVAKCCGAIAGAAFFEILAVLGDVAAVRLLLSGSAIVECIFTIVLAYLFVNATFFDNIDIITL